MTEDDEIKRELERGVVYVRTEAGPFIRVERKKVIGAVKQLRRRINENRRLGTSASREERVEVCADLMRSGKWVRRKTPERLAKEWEVSPVTVAGYSSEASRRVAWENTDRETVKNTCSNALALNIDRATKDRKYGDVAKIADVWTKVTGAREPEKHEHLHAIERFEQMSPRSKIMWLNERIQQMQNAREELLMQVEEEEQGLYARALTVSTG